MPESHESYPLAWPAGWPRTKSPQSSRFDRHITLYKARSGLEQELRLLHATSIVLSTNIPVRLDGLPYSKAREPADHGVAVYFRIKNEPRVLAGDKWDTVAHNMVALRKHVSAMRGQLRWGIGSVEQAFGGYRALPAMPEARTWWQVLGVREMAPWEVIEQARLKLLATHHPDVGGTDAVAAEINWAFDEAKKERKTP
jgi:hypothetical protein